MNLIQVLKISFSVLKVNKIRSLLTSLGVIIGIASVIVIVSVGAGAQSLIVNQVNSVGANLLAILPGASDKNGPPAIAFGIVIKTLKYEDAVAIGKEVPNIIGVSAYVAGSANMTYQSKNGRYSYYGVMSSYTQVENSPLAEGRFFTDEEERSSAKVVVLGSSVWEDLFDGDQAVGKRIKIKNQSFEVIGVLKKRGISGFQNQDDMALVPTPTAQSVLTGKNYLTAIRAKVDKAENIDLAVNDVEALIRSRHNIEKATDDDFSVRTTRDSINVMLNITNALKFFLAAIAAISLIVGGVGIMNIMLASVNERIREIGLRKAVGARREDIMIQFVAETVAITLIGGLLGVIIGSLIALLVALVARYLGYNWDLVIGWESIVLGVGVSGLVGFIFGLYPANRAAKLDPISALRYE